MKRRITSLALTIAMLCALMPILPAQAAASIDIGDYVQMGSYCGEPILWRCVDIDENGPLMLADKIICIKPYDAEGEANTTTGSHSRNSYRQSWGSNYWADSNMRSWLNSNESAGNVTWLCGNPPDEDHVYYNSYDDEAGFLTNFSTSELNAVKEVTQKSILSTYDKELDTTGATTYHYYDSDIEDVVQNYDSCYAENVTDKMFLLDVKQVNEVYNNSDVLGEDYYIGELTEEACNDSEYSISYSDGKKWYYWLRSPYASYDHYVRCVLSDGRVDYDNATDSGVGVRPAFYLNLQSAIFKSGSGTSSDPYTVEAAADSSSTSNGAPIITSAKLTSGGTTYDILKKTVNFQEGDSANTTLNVDVDANGNNNVKVYLKQGTKTSLEVPSGGLTFSPGEALKGGKAVYLLAIDETNRKSTSTKVNLKVNASKNSSTSSSGLNFKLGKDIGFTIPDSVPVFGNMEIGFGLDYVPITFEYDGDNKVNIAFGIDSSNVDETTGRFKGFSFEDYKATLKSNMKKGMEGYTAAKSNAKLVKELKKKYPDMKFDKVKFNVSSGFDTNTEVTGYAEMAYVDGSWKFSEGFLALNAEISYEYQGQIFIWVVPCYYEFGGEVGAGVEGKLTNVDLSGFTPSLEGYISAKVGASVGGGIGIAKVCTVGASGSGSLNIKCGLHKNYIKSWGVGDADFKVKVLGKTVAKKNMAHGEFLIYETGSSKGLIKDRAVSMQSTVDTYGSVDIDEVYENESRSYAENPTSWLGEDERLSLMSTDYTNKNLNKLADNIYTECAPQICEIDGTKVMVMQWDNTDRADADRTMLVYSVYDDAVGTWSVPSAVYDDGTADFYPCFKDGYLVWQNEKTKLDDDMTLADIGALGEIYAAKWNGNGFDTPVQITDNAALDTLPQVAANGDGASVVWTTNTENDILGTSGSNSIMRSDFDGTAWSEPTEVKSGLNAVVNLAVGTVNNTFTVAYVSDDDNDLSTIDDRDIRIIANNSETQLTDNEILDSNPVFANNTIYYYSDGNIVYSNVDGTDLQTVFAEAKGGLNDSFVVDSNANGDTAIWWTKTDENSTEVYSSLYKDNEWSDEIRVTDVGNKAKYPCGLINDDGSMVVAFNNAILEDNEITKTDLYTISVNPSYDLEITDAYVDETNSTAYITVKNSGELAIDEYNITTDYGDVTSVTTSLRAGETAELEIAYNSSKAADAKSVIFTAQLTEGEEYNTNNNSVSLDVCSADITVENVAVNEDETTITADISNTGLTDAENVTLLFREESVDGKVIDSRTISLSAGDAQNIEFAVDKTAMRFFDAQKLLYITAECEQDEMSLGNNDGYVYIASTSGSPDYQNDILNYGEIDGKWVVNSVAVNNTSSSVSCTIYAAVYSSDGILKGCGTQDANIAAEDDIGVDITLNCDIESGDTIKTFMWNDSLEPLAEFSELTAE